MLTGLNHIEWTRTRDVAVEPFHSRQKYDEIGLWSMWILKKVKQIWWNLYDKYNYDEIEEIFWWNRWWESKCWLKKFKWWDRIDESESDEEDVLIGHKGLNREEVRVNLDRDGCWAPLLPLLMGLLGTFLAQASSSIIGWWWWWWWWWW